MFTIVITEKGGKKKRVEFDEESITVGRVQGNQVILPRGNVSKQHCKVEYRGGEFRLSDIGSTNGTYVNGRRISAVTIVQPGDKVYVGEFILGFEPGAEDIGSSSPLPPVPAPKPKTPPSSDSVAPPLPSPPSSFGHKPPKKPLDDDATITSIDEDATPSVTTNGDDFKNQMKAVALPKIALPKIAPAKDAPVPKPVPKPATAAIVPPSGSVKSGQLDHLLDFVALEVKRIERQKMPCSVEEGTAGRVRIVFREIIGDMVKRNKLDANENVDTLLFQAFLAAVDVGPLSIWLNDEEVSEIRILGPQDIQLRHKTGWTPAQTTFDSQEHLANSLKCLGAGLPHSTEGELAGMSKYQMESGPLVIAQNAPISPIPNAIIYKNSSLRGGPDAEPALQLPKEVRQQIVAAIETKKRIGVVGTSLSARLAISMEIARLLPKNEFGAAVEELPLLHFHGNHRISLIARGIEKSQNSPSALLTILQRALDLEPDWLIARSTKWKDILDLLGSCAGRQGVLIELPIRGTAALDREMSVGLLSSAATITPEAAGMALASSLDVIIIGDMGSNGLPIVKQILQMVRTAKTWSPTIIYQAG